MAGDPAGLIRQLLAKARKGEPELIAIAGYTILKELGRGGCGAVYLARHDSSGEELALKVMLPKVRNDPGAMDYFLRETRNTKALDHPNVVALKENGCSQGVYFFTMEFCNGGSVDKLVKRQPDRRLPIKTALEITLQALEGLSYAHQAPIPYVKLASGWGSGQGLVHRDLKPHNLFIATVGGKSTIKIADFGLAKAFDQAGLSGQTASGAFMGSPVFMPRQLVLNFRYAQPDVDVWAMAASLYYMITGTYPREPRPDMDPWLLTLTSDPVPIRRRNPAVPPRLAQVIDTALVDNPKILIPSADELKRELLAAVA